MKSQVALRDQMWPRLIILTFHQNDDICYFQLNMKTDLFFSAGKVHAWETLDSMLNNDQWIIRVKSY